MSIVLKNIRVTKNTVICKIYSECELLIFEIPDNVSVNIDLIMFNYI